MGDVHMTPYRRLEGMVTTDERRPDGSELVAALGLIFVVAGVYIWFRWILPTTTAGFEAMYELVVHVLFGLVMLGLGVHIERSELTTEERYAVMVWCFAGFLFLFGLAIWSQLGDLLTVDVTRAFVSQVVVFGGMGGAFGSIIGINRGRATRNRMMAERIEGQRETLILLTRLLRHDIRNDMAMITGHAELLEDHIEEGGVGSLEVIQRRSEAIDRLLKDTDTLVDTLETDREFEPIDLTRVIEEELGRVRDGYPEVELDVDLPPEVTVIADGLVHQMFLNLFQNAINHNDPEGLLIRVSVTDTQNGTAEIVVEDNGTGIPPDLREQCFELGKQGPDSDGDGLGLYLVSRLVEVYEGEIELDEGPAGGARFQITLPTVSASFERGDPAPEGSTERGRLTAESSPS